MVMLNWRDKVLTSEDAEKKVIQLRSRGLSVAFTNGCFDIIHAGHVRYLMFARSCADALILGLNSDASVKGLKGSGRPINCQEERAEVIAALVCVDIVVIFDEPTPERLISQLKPEVYVKGGDYRNKVLPEAELVNSYGGRVVLSQYYPGVSTSSIIVKSSQYTMTWGGK